MRVRVRSLFKCFLYFSYHRIILWITGSSDSEIRRNYYNNRKVRTYDTNLQCYINNKKLWQATNHDTVRNHIQHGGHRRIRATQRSTHQKSLSHTSLSTNFMKTQPLVYKYFHGQVMYKYCSISLLNQVHSINTGYWQRWPA